GHGVGGTFEGSGQVHRLPPRMVVGEHGRPPTGSIRDRAPPMLGVAAALGGRPGVPNWHSGRLFPVLALPGPHLVDDAWPPHGAAHVPPRSGRAAGPEVR